MMRICINHSNGLVRLTCNRATWKNWEYKDRDEKGERRKKSVCMGGETKSKRERDIGYEDTLKEDDE